MIGIVIGQGLLGDLEKVSLQATERRGKSLVSGIGLTGFTATLRWLMAGINAIKITHTFSK
jgi:hypothetical protein